MIDSPIFLVGAERSGTTVLRLMLDSHPDVTMVEGFEYAVEHVAADGTPPPLDRFEQALGVDQVFTSSGFAVDHGQTYLENVNRWLAERRDPQGTPEVGAMIHWALPRIPLVWPKARFVRMLRDPRDVASSVMAMGWAGNVFVAVDKWLEAERGWSELEASLTPDQYVTVRFEDLMKDPDAELRRICGFLGIEFTDSMYDYTTYTDYDRPSAGNASRWRGKLSRRQVQLIEARTKELLVDRGFELSGFPHRPVSEREERFWRFHSRAYRWYERVRRVGPKLFVLRLVSKLIRSDKLYRHVRQQEIAIERAARKKAWRED